MKKMFTGAAAMALAAMMLLSGCGDPNASAGSAATTAAPAATTAAAAESKAETKAEAETKTEAASAGEVDWPKQPVNVMCPAAAGGGTDLMLRILNEAFTKKTGQPFVITNVKGISGYEQTHQANPDGYNYILGTTTIFTSEADGTLTYDWNDYSMVAFVPGNYTTVIAVQADSPYKDINDLLEAAKKGEATGGITLSGQPYLFALALKEQTGIDLYYVDTGNTSERNAALLGGQVDYIITNTAASQGYVDSGDFRFLAIDGEERYELAPDVPTFKEQGVDFCFVAQPLVWLAPEGTDPAVCEKFNSILAELYADPAVQEEFKKINTILYPLPNVEESVKAGEDFAAAVTPYAVKK